MIQSPRHSISLNDYRQQFLALHHKSYFNFGGQGPMPQGAIAAIQQAHLRIQQQGPFSQAVNSWVETEAAATRGAIATELHTTATTITLTEAVSVGCNIPLWGLTWQPGDHIVLTDCEHPGIVAAINEISRRFGVTHSTVSLLDLPEDADPVRQIEQHLRPNTRLVVISHVLWNTGQILPLAEIVATCHAFPANHGPVRVLVDAAQSVGMMPLDLPATGVDFYAFTGHKWWCGPAGLGGLYISPEALADLSPTFIGWRGITSDAQGQPTGWKTDGRQFEVATSDFALYGALREAIALHSSWGTPTERYQRLCHLSHYLWEQLQTIPQITCLRPVPPATGLVSFRMAGVVHRALVSQLEAEGFYLRTLLYPDCIRACVHYFTLESEIDTLIARLAASLKA